MSDAFGEQDRGTPVELSQEIAAAISGSRLVIVPACGPSGWLRIERLTPGEHANRLIVTPRIGGDDIDRFPPTLTDRKIGCEGWTPSEYRRRKLARRLGKDRPRQTSAVIMTIARRIWAPARECARWRKLSLLRFTVSAFDRLAEVAPCLS
jgi:hypothetical protein